jgi:Heavy metal binding domain
MAALCAVLFLGGGALALSSCREKPVETRKVSDVDYYNCAMHTFYHSDKPGSCPICGMTLVPHHKAEGTGGAAAAPAPEKRKIKFWANPMDPSVHSDKPMKDPMGMDYVPVYEEASPSGPPPDGGRPDVLKGLAPVTFSTWQQRLIGMRTDRALDRTVTRVIRTVGRFAGGPSDFASAAGDFAAMGKVVPREGRYLVADVYELDFPYVRKGQKAWISSFSGSGPRLPGKVTRICPYDQTQSRVRQVRIDLEASPVPGQLFDNVEIEAASPPVLSVPREAVMATGLRSFVFVEKEPGVFIPEEVTVGFQGDDDWQILSGLEAGATVVDGANFMLDADSQIQANFDSMDAQ